MKSLMQPELSTAARVHAPYNEHARRRGQLCSEKENINQISYIWQANTFLCDKSNANLPKVPERRTNAIVSKCVPAVSSPS